MWWGWKEHNGKGSSSQALLLQSQTILTEPWWFGAPTSQCTQKPGHTSAMGWPHWWHPISPKLWRCLQPAMIHQDLPLTSKTLKICCQGQMDMTSKKGHAAAEFQNGAAGLWQRRDHYQLLGFASRNSLLGLKGCAMWNFMAWMKYRHGYHRPDWEKMDQAGLGLCLMDFLMRSRNTL